VVNVSAVEGQFLSTTTKTDKHRIPHWRMRRSNMMTRTSAPDFVQDGIHMNAVDYRMGDDEDPAAHAARKAIFRLQPASRHHRRRSTHRRSDLRRAPHEPRTYGTVLKDYKPRLLVARSRASRRVWPSGKTLLA